MPAEGLSMRKIKEVLRLKFELGLKNRQIARSCSINHGTVSDYISRSRLRAWSNGRYRQMLTMRYWRRRYFRQS